MYKILNEHTAPNLKDLFCKKNVFQNTHNFRNSETDLALPKPKTDFLMVRSFGYSGAILLNLTQHQHKKNLD
jgi:hypothetical protein